MRSHVPRWLQLHAIVLYAFLYLPILVLVVYSFNGEGVGGFPPRHLTLSWYAILAGDGACHLDLDEISAIGTHVCSLSKRRR